MIFSVKHCSDVHVCFLKIIILNGFLVGPEQGIKRVQINYKNISHIYWVKYYITVHNYITTVHNTELHNTLLYNE